MTYQQPGPPEPEPRRRAVSSGNGVTVDAARLWSGGVATAVVAALVALVGLLIARGVFDITVLTRTTKGTWDAASAVPYALAAGAWALIATGIMHLLLLSTPRPRLFFGWIMFLVGAVVLVGPFTTDAALAEQVASAIIGVLVVIAVASLVSGTAARAVTIDWDRGGTTRSLR